MSNSKNTFFTKDHEWVSVDGDIATVGITQYATDELGEIVYVELPEIGQIFSSSDEFGTVESVKTVSSLYAPISGEVSEINDVVSSPEIINESPMEAGWLIRLKIDDSTELEALMTDNQYSEFTDQ